MTEIAINDARGRTLSEALAALGVKLPMVCAGRGTCGKCAVWISGRVSSPSAEELRHLSHILSDFPPAEGFQPRLACLCTVLGDCRVIMPEDKQAVILGSDTESLPEYDGEGTGDIGIAADIGTTTVALNIYDLPAGKLLHTVCGMNAQSFAGADVLSRIAYSNKSGHKELHQVIKEQLSGMIQGGLNKLALSPDRVARLVLTGNTTMLHFAAGLDPAGIGVSPFVPESLFGYEIPGSSIFGFLPTGASLYFPKCVGAYIGADITCGLLSSDMGLSSEGELLVDVGTNGEMALCDRGRILCCATAAGPAFEGARISVGMTASEGAVYKIVVRGGEICCETIGGAKARGICGTGLISAVAMMLEHGVIDEGGAIVPEGHGFAEQVKRDGSSFLLGKSGVALTSGDIREVQLAKAAIAAGIDVILSQAGLSEENISRLVLAGGFGSYIDPAEAARIGLISAALAGKASASGNSALAGASAMLFSISERRKAEALAGIAVEIPLAGSAVFTDSYIENMCFATAYIGES